MSGNGQELGPVAPLYTDQTVNPAIPAAGAGPDIRSLRGGSGRAPKYVQIEIDLASGTTVTLPAPVRLYGERGGVVRYLVTLNWGQPITVEAAAGYMETLQAVAIQDRLAIVAGDALVGGGGFSARLVAVKGAP